MKKWVVLLSVLFFNFLTLTVFAQIMVTGVVEGAEVTCEINLVGSQFSVEWQGKRVVSCDMVSWHSELESLERPQDYVQVLCACTDGKEVWRGGFFPKKISGAIEFPTGKLVVVTDPGYSFLDFKLYPRGHEVNYHSRFSQVWTGNIVRIITRDGKEYLEIKRDLDQKEAFYIVGAEGELKLFFSDGTQYTFKYAGPDFLLQETGVGKTEMRATRLCLSGQEQEVVFWKNTWNGEGAVREELLNKEGLTSVKGSILLKQDDGTEYELVLQDSNQIVLSLLQQGGDKIPVQIGNQIHCSWVVEGSTGWNQDGLKNPIRFICIESSKGATLPLR